MNKKTLILLAMAATLAIPSANATSTITGVTNGGSGSFDIAPEFIGKVNGSGFRKYDQFNLGQGDTANLIFQGTKDNKTVDINTFINLVNDKININGVVNTMKNNNFFNGHAVFISPNGMVVGQSGVLNVGRLSTVTPNAGSFKTMTDAYDAYNASKTAENARQLEDSGVFKFLSNSKEGGSWGSNGDIEVNGKIYAREGVVLRGQNVNVKGDIVNGLGSDYNKAYNSADALFSALVNTNGIKTMTSTNNRGSQVVIESDNQMYIENNAKIANVDNGGTFITNRGSAGTTVTDSSSLYAKDGELRVYNKDGNLNITGSASLEGDDVRLFNTGNGYTLNANTTVNGEEVRLYHKGSGNMNIDSDIHGENLVRIKNMEGSTGNLSLGGDITSDGGEIGIRNQAGSIMSAADITNNNGNIGIVNEGTDMTVGGNISNEGSTGIINLKNIGTGVMDVDATIQNTSRQGYSSNQVNNTTTYITNITGSGLDYNGSTIVENGDLAINNYNGDMNVEGSIDATNANVGIIDRYGADSKYYRGIRGGDMNVDTNLTINKTTSGGRQIGANIKKEEGTTGNMAVNGTIKNDNAFVTVIDNAGKLNLGADVTNNGKQLRNGSTVVGGFYAVSKNSGTGIDVADSFNMTGNGEVLIRNMSGSNGLNYSQNANIETTGYQAALVNNAGNMNVAGDIKANTVVVRAGTKAAPVNGKMTVTGKLDSANPSYIVNWYEGSNNYVNNSPANDTAYTTGGSRNMTIRQQEVK